jgi:DNA-binding transcriptional MerR regulator
VSRLGLLTPAETAERLGVTTHTLARWRRQGRGPAWRRLSRGTVRYFCASVRRWLAEQGGEDR